MTAPPSSATQTSRLGRTTSRNHECTSSAECTGGGMSPEVSGASSVSDMKRSVTHHSRPGRFEARAVLMVLAMVSLAAGCADDGEPALVDPVSEPTMAPDAGLVVTDPVTEGMPVVLDYSPTISDIGALLYLASHPDVDLLAVTLPERGESDCDLGVRHTLSLLAIADQHDVPVGCGVEPPLVGDRDWPDEFRQFSNLLAA